MICLVTMFSTYINLLYLELQPLRGINFWFPYSDSLECIEQPVQSILAQMECHGISFKSQRLKAIELQIQSRLEELNATAAQITQDDDFLLSSPQQVSSFLYDHLKLTVPAGLTLSKNKKTDHRSTSGKQGFICVSVGLCFLLNSKSIFLQLFAPQRRLFLQSEPK